jgi:hypothetical protein
MFGFRKFHPLESDVFIALCNLRFVKKVENDNKFLCLSSDFVKLSCLGIETGCSLYIAAFSVFLYVDQPQGSS